MTILKRTILFLVSILVLIGAILFSGLNTAEVNLNLYYTEVSSSLGFLMIVSLLLGFLLGLLLFMLAFYLPMKSQLRKANRRHNQLLKQNR